MKKFLFILFVLTSLTVVACNGSQENQLPKISGIMTILVTDSDSMPVEDFSKVRLILRPLYSDKTLDVEYQRTFPNKIAKEKDMIVNGTIGNEYFDRFENIAEFVMAYRPTKDSVKPSIDEGGQLQVIFSADNNRNYQIDTYWNDNTPGLEEIRAFYTEVIDILTQTEQV